MSTEPEAYEPRYTHYFVVAATRTEDGTIDLRLDGGEAMAVYDDRPVWDYEENEKMRVTPEREADDKAFDSRLSHLLSAQDKFAAYNAAVVDAALFRASGDADKEQKRLWDAIKIANTVFGDNDLPEEVKAD